MSKLQTLIFAFALSTSVFNGYCQEKPSILAHEVAPHWYVFNKPGYLVKTDNNIPLLVKDFIPICKEEFGLSERDELRPKDGFRATPTGVAKYQQYYDGYEVEGATVIVESKQDTVTMVSSYLVGNLDLITSNPISKLEALSIALSAIHETFIWQDPASLNGYCRNYDGSFDSIRYRKLLPKGTLCIAKAYNTTLETDNYRFAWRFCINTVSREFRILVDANNGDLYEVVDQTCHITNQFDEDAVVYTLYDNEHFMETYKLPLFSMWTL